jgi:hypothetical protein
LTFVLRGGCRAYPIGVGRGVIEPARAPWRCAADAGQEILILAIKPMSAS